MLRTSGFATEQWGDKLMSVLREQQLEACQERLARYLHQGIYEEIGEEEMQFPFAFSYYAREMRGHKPSLAQLRGLVLERLPQEACFLSPVEEHLIIQMLTHNGRAPIRIGDELSGAESLISRLWCTLHIQEPENQAFLCLAPEVMKPLEEAMISEKHARIRAHLFSFQAVLHSLLYLSGFLHTMAPMEHFQQTLGKDDMPHSNIFITRFMCASFDYVFLPTGDMLLVHPGLADPERMVHRVASLNPMDVQLTPEMMLGGMNGVLPEEVACCEAMRGALIGAVRPEVDPGEVLEDLKMMAKQGASFAELREVMESVLCVLPTPRMLSALSQLHLQIVRWAGIPSAVLN